MHGRYASGVARVRHSRHIEHIFKKMYREDSYSERRGECGYCESRLKRGGATADHITPIYLGGQTSRENIVVACEGCNKAKGSMTAGKFRNLLNAKEPPAWDGSDSFEVVKAWIRYRIAKRVKKAERRIKKFVGMPL